MTGALPIGPDIRPRHVPARVAVSAECEDLVDVVGTAICRIVQEALSNALRHAKPKRVAISIERDHDLERGRDEIRLSVVDDGQGMRDPDKLGYGLIGISEGELAHRLVELVALSP